MDRRVISISGYHHINQIYEGNKSAVFRAIRDGDDIPVIVKLRNQFRGIATNEHPLFSEADALKRISSEYVPRFYELREESEELVLIYEDIVGDTLVSADAKTPLSLLDRLDVARRIAMALHDVHTAQIVHRDVNPSNIVWNSATGRLQVIDFGLAMPLDLLKALPLPESTFQGTLTYIAPEQTGRVNRAVDYRTDLYSLGASLYELFTNKPPFLADSDLELIHAHIAKTPKAPAEIESFVPQVVSDIVMKLLSKSAEDRYQTAAGVGNDLSRCIDQLRATGSCVTFVLGAQDTPQRLSFSDKVYGREQEFDAMKQAFDSVRAGAAELVLVSGYSGVGKTALCETFADLVRDGGGIFSSGKFDQLQGGVPYSAFRTALTDIVKYMLKQDESDLRRSRDRLLTAAGANAQIMIDFIPDLELVLGSQTPAADLEPNEAQNRFNEVLKRFLETFARPRHPLVIFLDDVQWMDPATLRLLRAIMCDLNIGNLMVLAAFRSDEIEDTHLLTDGLSYFVDNGVSVRHLELYPLDVNTVSTLLAEALGASTEEVQALAEAVIRKTDGNPFFLKEFVSTVYERGLIEFDSNKYRWTWNINKIDEMSITDNVVDLLSNRIGSLDKKSIDILSVAACIGSKFRLDILAGAADLTGDVVQRLLGPALREQFIYEELESLPVDDAGLDEHRSFSFSHDRIQHTVYNLVPEQERERLHLSIGNAFLSSKQNGVAGELSFDAVDHLNRGGGLLTDLSDKTQLAVLNLEAGVKAKTASAYRAAKGYLQSAMELIASGGEPEDPDFLFRLYCESAEVAHMNGEFDESRSYVNKALSQTDSVAEKAKLHNLVIVQQTLQGSYHEAIDVGRSALLSLGIALPETGVEAELEQELGEAQKIDALHDQHVLLNMPKMVDTSILAAMRILMNLFPPSLFVNPSLNSWIAVKMVNLSMEFGYAPETPKGLTNYGSVLAVRGDYQGGYAFGNLALQVIDKQGAAELKPRVLYAFLGDLNHWARPLRSTKEMIEDAYVTCIEYGELPYAGYILTFARCMNEIFLGDSLQRFKVKTTDAIAFVRKTQNTHAEGVALAAYMAISNLLGETDGYNSFDTELIAETEYMRESEARDDYSAICFLRILQAQNLYFFGYPKEALTSIRSAQRLSSHLSTGMPLAMLNLYSSLIYAFCIDLESDARTQEYLNNIKENQLIMEGWADDCPDNFMHGYYLVQGELARIHGDDIKAVNLYNQAMNCARKTGFKQFEALAHELAARFWRDRGNDDYARRHINRAYRYYYQWGAVKKLELMQEAYAGILTVAEDDGTEYLRSPQTVSSESTLNKQKFLDLEAISSASQSISREIKFQALLDKLAKTIIEVAGAEKYVLLLIDEASNNLAIRSTHDLGADGVAEPKTEPEQVTPISLIRYVSNTKQTVLIEDGAKDAQYRDDPYIVQHSPKSILCVPIQYQSKLLGVLYLENNSATGSFTTQSLETLEILSTQAAISIHNAVLYESLEDKVAHRTRDLDQLNQELEQRVHSQVDQIEKLNKLRRFLSPQVSEMIVSEGNEALLESHRKEIAILFCDLRGFTAFSESVEPEEAMDMLTEYHQTIGALITKYQATIDHRAGDGMMIFLNDPIPSEDPIKEAVSLAIELREMVNKLTSKWEQYGHSLGFGIGISYGYATIGMIGYEGSYDYAATGRYVNLASRLCDEALHNQILITQRIQAELLDDQKTEYVEDFDMKGFHSKIPAYNVLF